MTNSVRRSLVPFLLRGFLRLLVLTTPLLILFAALDADRRRVTWVEPRDGDARAELPSWLGTPRTGTSVEVEGRIRYVVDHASTGLWLLSLLPALVLALAVSSVALLLLRLMHETYAGRPFSDHGVRRLRLVAAVVGAAAVVLPLLDSVSSHAIVARVLPDRAPGIVDGWDILGATIPWLVVALLVLAVAEAFDIGVGLADDVAGLV
ncbi:MAG: hypothetical protein QOD98_2579 [Nocardioidaceae bacterium]|jgi:hypothetical protein|nr:hypothetical protein [Nocardioidaceae bacterium]